MQFWLRATDTTIRIYQEHKYRYWCPEGIPATSQPFALLRDSILPTLCQEIIGQAGQQIENL